MTVEDVRNALRNFIVTEAGVGNSEVLTDDMNLVESGILDSLSFVALLAFCEEHLQCVLDVDALTGDDAVSIGRLASIICQQRTPSTDDGSN